MTNKTDKKLFEFYTPLSRWPLPAKALVSMILLMIAIGFCFALGQVIVHDVIPTIESFENKKEKNVRASNNVTARGDLFSLESVEAPKTPFYEKNEFIFALKFTHIHLFGMSAIFIIMGFIVLFLKVSSNFRTWLVVLPFCGVIIDLAAVWLKLFISPYFFWLHFPGGMLMAVVFLIVFFIAMHQMWMDKPLTKNRS